MVVGCVQHYSTYFAKKLGKSLDLLFVKSKIMQKMPKNGKNADFSKNQPFLGKKQLCDVSSLIGP